MKKSNHDHPNTQILFSGFDQRTKHLLEVRWEQFFAPGFFHDANGFWRERIQQDYNLMPDVMSLIHKDYEMLYRELYKLQQSQIGTLLPRHTQLFLERYLQSSVVISLLQNDLDACMQISADMNLDRDAKKELQLVAALCGSTDIVRHLTALEGFKLDLEVLNMAIWSGKYHGESLAYFTAECKPSYDSLRYAVKSQNEAVVRDMLEVYQIPPSADYLTIAASTGNANIFNLLIAFGAKPEGELVFKMANLAENKDIAQTLQREYSYGSKS